MTTSVFEKFRPRAYPYAFDVELTVDCLAGGLPTHPKVAAGWIKTKLGFDDDELIAAAVAEVMVERGIENPDEAPEDALNEAVDKIVADRHLNGFARRAGAGTELCISGRHVKAMLKEAACIRWPDARWGPTRKGTKSFFAEHFFVAEDVIGLGVTEPSDVHQRFVHTFRGNGIQYEEVVDGAKVAFTLYCDYDLGDEAKNAKKGEGWALLWLTGESNGLGASRSQGYGKFAVTRFEARP